MYHIFVDATYYFSDNPEWMVYESEGVNYFFYILQTLKPHYLIMKTSSTTGYLEALIVGCYQ